MAQEIKIVTLPLKMGFLTLGDVNCYLVKTDTGYILIDTGPANQRAHLESELARAGCQPGNLKLIVLTHGDFDHTSNGAYLHQTYRTKIVMHRDDCGMVERGDMFWNRQKGSAVLRMLAPILFGFGKSARFTPDAYIEEGCTLSGYGIEAAIVHIPGHSKGSIGILTASGDLFCGDLFTNIGKPVLNSIMDDLAAAKASVEKLKSLNIKTVYPGHGTPFMMEQVIASSN